MAALTSALFVALFTSSWIFVPCQGTLELKVKLGENATLQCRSQRNATIEVIKWSRTDLKSDDYIFLFKDDHSNLTPSYRGRVELRDSEMKDGDASVILKNVKTNDTGTYECRIIEEKKAGRRKRDVEPELISAIKLKVTAGSVGLKVDLSVLLLLAVGGFMF